MPKTRKGRVTPRNSATGAHVHTRAPRPDPALGARAAQPQAGNTLRIALLASALVAIIAVGATLFFAFSKSGASPAVPPSPEGRISFVRQNDDGSRDLYVVNPDGTGQQKVTSSLKIEGSTAWSPDGRRIIIQGSVNNVSTIVRVDVGLDNKGSNPVQLTADIKADSVLPAWSPDGKLIAFQSKKDGGDYQVFLMDPDGGGKRRISDGKGYAGQPAWSPDGTKVAYVAGEGQTGSPKDLYVVPVAGGAAAKLTGGGKDISTPRWSPDGQSILYLDNQGDRNNTMMIMNADGGNPRVLVNQGANRSPSFSPDGTMVAYYSVAPPAGSDVFIVPVNGGATSNLTHLSSDDYDPAWSPDGKKLAWAGRSGEEYKIFTGTIDGAQSSVVSNGAGRDYQPLWAAAPK